MKKIFLLIVLICLLASCAPEPDEVQTTASPSVTENTAGNPDDMVYNGVTLTHQKEDNKVCIEVQPSGIREYISYYYIPENAEQERLINLVNELPSGGQPFDKRWQGMKETGWKLIYNDKTFTVFEGGYLYYTYTDEADNNMEYFVQNNELCGYIQNMLEQNLNYYPFDISGIKNITSAKLEVCNTFTDNKPISQTITDKDTLAKFEEWFSNAEYIYGGAECGNQQGCLEFTLESGEKVQLSIATDSCPNFGINGVYYDYRPTAVWDNSEFFRIFNEIPFWGSGE